MTVQVYWPSDLLKFASSPSQRALVLGEQAAESVFIVVTLLQYSSANDLDTIEALRKEDHLYYVKSTSLSVIGTIGEPLGGSSTLNFEVKDNKLRSPNAIIVIYQPPLPTRQQFYSATPIPISFTNETKSETQYGGFKFEMAVYHPRKTALQEEQFETVVNTLNLCWLKRDELLTVYPEIEKAWQSQKSIWAFINQLSSWIFLKFYSLLKPGIRIILYLMVFVRHIMLISIRLLNWKLFKKLPSLVEISATAQQFDLRLQQFSYFPIQYIKTTRKFRSEEPNALPIREYPEYIRLYNTLWLIINDVSLGIIVGSFLNNNRDEIIEFFQRFVIYKFLYTDIKFISTWLTNSPGGIKLNNELCSFLNEIFIWVVDFWHATLIQPLVPHFSCLFSSMALSSAFGLTFFIAALSDFTSLLTLHIYWFYYVSAKIYNWQLEVITSLFYLFYGQKRNVLRNRIDSNDYELDQLFLGTLMFIVLMFLLPTILAFYVTFTITELSIFAFIGSFEIILALLNYFPLFVLLLRLKDHKRIPGGVKFVKRNDYINIAIKPIGISQMFSPFTEVLENLNTSYFSKEALIGILRGYVIHLQRSKLYMLLYSALPSKLISTSDLWKELRQEI